MQAKQVFFAYGGKEKNNPELFKYLSLLWNTTGFDRGKMAIKAGMPQLWVRTVGNLCPEELNQLWSVGTRTPGEHRGGIG